MPLTTRELAVMEKTQAKIARLKSHLDTKSCPETNSTLKEWLDYLSEMKKIVGNAHNDMTFVASLMARDYLCRKLLMREYDVAATAMGASGLDIDERTVDNKRVIAEIKTTMPYGTSDLGSQQKSSFFKDFEKLNAKPADYKFFFVTTDEAFALMKKRYATKIPGVHVVLLTTGEEFCAETL